MNQKRGKFRGKKAEPSVEELEFIYDLLARGFSDQEVLEEMQGREEFLLRTAGFIKRRRREYNVAKRIFEQKFQQPALLSGVELAEHLETICKEAFAKLRLSSLLRPMISDRPSAGEFVAYDRDEEIRRHSGHSGLVTKVAGAIKSAQDFSELTARQPGHPIGSIIDEWTHQADLVVDGFRHWYANEWHAVEQGAQACFEALPSSYDDVTGLIRRLMNTADKAEAKGFVIELTRMVDRPKFQQLQTVISACGLLQSGISELPPDPFWADELSELAHIEAFAYSARPLVPKDFAGQMDATNFWDQVDETRKLLALADKLRQTEARILESIRKLASL